MILDDIVKTKKKEVEALKKNFTIPSEKAVSGLSRPRDFIKALKKESIALIAETKAASPSSGVFMKKYEPAKISRLYEDAGADAISVLTDPGYFMGSTNHLKMVKSAVLLPLLRKDFIIDELQIYESRVIGADAILLIARILETEKLERFIRTAGDLGMACLVEVRTAQEARAALDSGAEIIGINNRDLDSLAIDLNTTINIMKEVPELKKKIVVSESGIKSGKNVATLRNSGINAILVGEALLKSHDISAKIKELKGQL